MTCKEHICINDCSNHGNCQASQCHCDLGYYGADCSSTEPLYEQCLQLDQLAGTVCARLKFKDDCTVDTGIYLDGESIIDQSYSVSQFKSVFSQSFCGNGYYCNTCLQWKDLILNTTTASGCGTVSFDCFGEDYGTYNLGCFADNNVVPRCFGGCLNDCNFNGLCVNGICKCNDGYHSDDCSQNYQCDNTNCIHGNCVDNVCKCNKGYEGFDCNVKSDNDNDEEHKHSTGKTAAMVIVPILVVGVIVGVIAVIHNIRKKRQQTQHQFRHLDLLVEEDNDIDYSRSKDLNDDDLPTMGNSNTVN